MNVLPSMSWIREPDARRMKRGDAPTDLNARTGLSTPPGRIACARAKRREERVVFMAKGQGPSVRSPHYVVRFVQLVDRGGEITALVFVPGELPRLVERAPCRIDVALHQRAGAHADGGAEGRRIAPERASEKRARH